MTEPVEKMETDMPPVEDEVVADKKDTKMEENDEQSEEKSEEKTDKPEEAVEQTTDDDDEEESSQASREDTPPPKLPGVSFLDFFQISSNLQKFFHRNQTRTRKSDLTISSNKRRFLHIL